MQTAAQDQLIPISPATLVADAWPGVDIYLRSKDGAKPVLFFGGSDAPDPGRLEELKKSIGSKLYIDKSQRASYQQYLRENWRGLVDNSDVPVINRVGVMSDVMRDVLSAEFERGDTNRLVAVSKELGASACNIISDSPLIVGEMISVLHHDYGTFTHSTNVSLYCVILARELGISGTDLEQIAVGGLLHDLGKLQIDEKILNKPGRLSESEFRIVQQHPGIGYRQLCKRDDLSFAQLMMVYQHHEKLNGSGYPVACTEEDIHPWAKICTVVDVYEALTSHRPYRKPASRETALAVLNQGDGTEFDSEIVECWRNVLKTRT